MAGSIRAKELMLMFSSQHLMIRRNSVIFPDLQHIKILRVEEESHPQIQTNNIFKQFRRLGGTVLKTEKR